MKKPNNHSRDRKKPTKRARQKMKPVWLGEYRNLRDGEQKVVTQSFLEKFARHIVNEAYNNEEYFTASDLFLDMGIPEATYRDWVHNYDFFREAHNHAVSIIGRRREKNGLKRKFDASMVAFTMPKYDRVWKESLDYRAALKEKEKGSSAENITVVMAPFEESDMVPEKENKSSPETVAKKAKRQWKG